MSLTESALFWLIRPIAEFFGVVAVIVLFFALWIGGAFVLHLINNARRKRK